MIDSKHILMALLGLASAAAGRAVPVEVVRDGDGFALLRGGEPYFVRGVGIHATQQIDLLAAAGGNSVRTWGVDDGTLAQLDAAHALGMTVTVGVWLEHRSAGADYADEALKAKQRERVRDAVARFKDHPAVLMWGISNETEAGSNTEDYWRHLNDLALIAKEIDPHHPVMTVTAEIGGPGDGRPGYEARLAELAPAVDVWGINSYRGMFTLRERLDRRGVDRPWLVCEWGPRGHWESPRTEWGVPVEQSSAEKAGQMAFVYEKVIAASPDCLGGYAFLWNERPAATHTWFGLLTDRGEPTEMVDALSRLWTGAWPADRAPTVLGIETPAALGRVRPGERVPVVARAFDPEGGAVALTWLLRTDRHAPPGERPAAYGNEDRFGEADVSHLLADPSAAATGFEAPPHAGPYRLFLFARDAGGRVATANVPFLVDPEADADRRPATTRPAVPVVPVVDEAAGPVPDPNAR